MFQDSAAENLTDRGTLQVETVTGVASLPVQGVAVLVTGEDGPFEMLLYTRADGKTQVLELPAPPLAYSQMPNGPKPYAMYRLKVEKEGYLTVAFENVQVFPQTLSLQRAVMSPI